MNRRSWIIFILMGCIWGIPYLLIRIAIRDLTPETMIFFRCVLALVVLLPFALRQRRFDLIRQHWIGLIAYTAAEVVVPWYLIARAEEHVASSMAGLLIATVPLFGLLLALGFRNERRVRGVRLIGLLIGFVGVMVTIGIDIHGANTTSIIEIMITAFGYALGPVILNRYLSEIPAVTMVAASFVVATLIYLPFGVTHLPHHLSGESLGAVIALALVCSAAGFILFFQLILDVGPARATVVTYLNPIVAVIAGVIFLGEKFTQGLAIGLPLVIIGSILATWGVTHEHADVDNQQAGALNEALS